MFDFLTHRPGWRLPAFFLKSAGYLFAGAALMVGINHQRLRDFFQARERRQSYTDSVASLKKEYDRLLREQAELKSGGFETEKAIRENLLMVKPGEQILFIETPEDRAKAAPKPAPDFALKRAGDLKQSVAPKEAPDEKQVVATPVPETGAK